jgi:hypothetical protein
MFKTTVNPMNDSGHPLSKRTLGHDLSFAITMKGLEL